MARLTLCIIGLGYVGLPLAHAFAKAGHTVIGYDVKKDRIEELQRNLDRTNELSSEQLAGVTMELSADPAVIKKADVVILCIPTPVDDQMSPDLSLLRSATKTVGEYLKKGAIVVYESTVYPGVTEEICGRVLEEASGMRSGKDFTLGYSPERINPGDKTHTIDKIVKIVAGQDEKTTSALSELYGSIVKAGIHRAPSIKVAEMAKAIENAQRDLNIAFVNEIAILCHKIGIASKDVLAAAATKWNFLPFRPGLVGGHCIGVDPYYLVEKARQVGMMTHIVTAGRLINDGMSSYIVTQVCEAIDQGKKGSVLVLGLTFKENIPDQRNSKAVEVAQQLKLLGHTVDAHDPQLSREEILRLGLGEGSLTKGSYDAVLLLVPHREYVEASLTEIIQRTNKGGLIYDLKSILDGKEVEKAGRKYMAL